MSSNGSLLRGVDRAAFAAAFAARLRQRGVPVGFPAIEDFVRALGVYPPDSKSALYWIARISLVRRQSEIEAFDRMFAAAFEDATLALDPNARRGSIGENDAFAALPTPVAGQQDGGGLPWATLPPAVADAADSDSPLALPERLPSALDALADLPFEELDADRMRLLGDWLATVTAQWPTRRSRRVKVSTGGPRIAIRP
ncbi:MAG TPA: hypothetical protein VGD84_00205, partial [Pseudonocardiaceae bacterium]